MKDEKTPADVGTDPRIGTRIGGYEVESFLGRGGMGVVYKARHVRLGRMVALKILVPELAADETFRTRFVRESQMAASIDHPNVIPIYDADEIDGVLFLAMRLVEGSDLKVMLQQNGPLDPGATLAILAQIGGALDAAHDLGLIHRDVKSANVLVERRDEDAGPRIYLTDFGLTKHGSSRSGITATGAFIGTIDYIAPEQIEGNPVDARTDIYALGCVLFECLTGEVPFKKDADVAVMYAHMMDPRPKVTDRVPEIPPGVDEVLAKAMARQPDERYPTAGAMVEDLAAALGVDASEAAASFPTGRPAGTRTVPKVRGRRSISSRVLAVGAAAVLLLAGAAYLLTRPGPKEPATPKASVPTGEIFAAPDGSEGGDGTRDAPLDLVTAIANAEEGETIKLMDGTYTADAVPMLVIERSVIMEAVEGTLPVLQGDAEHPDGIYVTPGTSDVTISGINFDNFDGEALKFFCERCEKEPENFNISLRDLDFTGGGSPIIVENVEGLNVAEVKTQENFHTGLLCSPGPCNEVTIVESLFHSGSEPDADGVNIESGDEVYIETSDASFNGRSGFISGAANTQIIRSHATNNRDIGVSLTGSDSEIRDSIVALNRDVGLVMGEGGCDGCAAQGTFKVVNVLIADNGSEGISVENDDDDEIKFQMFNSILTDNGGTALVVSDGVRMIRLDFNLFDTAGSVAVTYDGTDYSENDLNHSRTPARIDGGTYASTPEFEGPNDYHLTGDSSGVNGGTQEGVVSQVDIDGDPRVAGDEIDMGPYERQ